VVDCLLRAVLFTDRKKISGLALTRIVGGFRQRIDQSFHQTTYVEPMRWCPKNNDIGFHNCITRFFNAIIYLNNFDTQFA
jgi:hypothetical protein